MKTIYILLISITLGLTQKPIYAAGLSHSYPKGYSLPAKFISLNGTINSNKVVLQWLVAENETADQFEVEKSVDGRNFTMAALVFGTDKAETDQYQFYEKANSEKVMYRIKLINKDHQTAYSSVIVIVPNVQGQKS